MAAYPSYSILLGSTIEEEDGVLDDFTTDGGHHSRIMYSARYYRFQLVHALTLSQWQALRTTYGAGKRDTYTLTYLNESPSVTYNVKFTGPPRITGNLGNNQFKVEVPLRGSVA